MAYHSTQGAKIQVSITAVLTDVPQCFEINPPGLERRFKDVTHLGSTGNFTEYHPLMNDTSEGGFKIRWDPDNSVHDYLIDQSLLATAVLDAFKIILTNVGASTKEFNAFIMRFQETIQPNDILEAEIGLRCSGAITYTI